jgi:hypothetical protein
MTRLISRNQLQTSIDSLAETSLNRLKKKIPEIDYTAFKDQVERESKYFLQQISQNILSALFSMKG